MNQFLFALLTLSGRHFDLASFALLQRNINGNH